MYDVIQHYDVKEDIGYGGELECGSVTSCRVLKCKVLDVSIVVCQPQNRKQVWIYAVLQHLFWLLIWKCRETLVLHCPLGLRGFQGDCIKVNIPLYPANTHSFVRADYPFKPWYMVF